MWPRLVAVVLVGCSAPARHVPVPAPPPARPSGVDVPAYAPPLAIAPPAFHNECHAFTPTGPPPQLARKKIYDFAPMIVAPVRRGPRAADRPRVGFARSTRDLRQMFAGNATEITDCWKSATSHGATATTLEVGVTVDPFGGTHDLAVTSARAQDDPLVACVARALSTVTFDGTTTRAIHLGATLVFELSGQPAWTRPVAAPVTRPDPDTRTGTVCTPVLDDGVVPEVRLPAPLHVTDWDASREPPRRNAVPEIRMGCATYVVDADKRAVRIALMSNFGAFQTCYADAYARDSTLAGDVMLRTNFSRGGAAATPQVTSGVGDPQLHACLVTALQDEWVAPGPTNDGGIEVNLTLTLTPPAPPPAADDPPALLAAGDADGALAAWTAKLRTPVSHALACRGRAGVVLAIAQLAPWLDDPRLTAAIADLARAASDLAPEAARTCVDEAAPVIGLLTHVRGQPGGAPTLTHVWLERYAAALPLAPYLTDGASLRWSYAEALLATPRAAEGLEILRKLAWDPKLGALVAEELTSRATRRDWIGDGCAD